MATRFVKMTWHILKDNPLEYVDNPYLVCNDDGKKVTLTREGVLDDYVIRIGGYEIYRSRDVVSVAGMLYAYSVGMDVPVGG